MDAVFFLSLFPSLSFMQVQKKVAAETVKAELGGLQLKDLGKLPAGHEILVEERKA